MDLWKIHEITSDPVKIAVANSLVGFFGTIISAIVVVLLAKINAKAKDAANDAKLVKEDLAKTNEANHTKLSIIADHSIATSDKLDGVVVTLEALKNLQQEMLVNHDVILDNRKNLLVNRQIIEEIHGTLTKMSEATHHCPLVEAKPVPKIAVIP